MINTHIKLTQEELINFKQDCFDYDCRNNDTHLRGRYIFMGLPDEQGFVCVEENTNGKFIVGKQASLHSANYFLNQC